MPYVKTNWLDRLVQFPNKFRVNNNGDGTSDIEEAPGEVFVQGTPVSAQNLNKMEQGIEDATRIAEEGTAAATQAEAEAGSNNVKKMTPLRVFQAIAKRITDLIATSAEAIAGTNNAKLMTPARTREFVSNFAMSRKDGITATTHPNLNDLKTPGMYITNQPNANQRSLNYPPNGANYAFMLVANTINNQTLQIFAGHSSQQFLYRVSFEGSWTAWQRLPLGTEIGELANLSTTTKTNLVAAINEIKASQTIATQNEAEAGTDNTRTMTPLRVSQSVAKRLRDNSKLDIYNILKNTYDFSFPFANKNRWSLTNAEESYKNFPTMKTTSQYFGLGQNATLEVGKYTFLVFAKSDAGVTSQIYVGASNGGKVNNGDNTGRQFGELLEWTQIKLEFEVTTRGSFNVRFEKANTANGFVYQSLIRLFEGDVERPWFRAINDNAYDVATEAETLEGTNNEKIITPLRLLTSKKYVPLGATPDLNTLKTVGNYFITFENYSGSNRPPFSIASGFYIEVDNINGTSLNLPKQLATQVGTGEVYSRTCTNANSDTWTLWKPLYRDVATQTEAQTATNNDKVMTPLRTTQLINSKYGLGGYVVLGSSTNYNDYTNTGFYRVPNDGINGPTGAATILQVIARTDNVLVQLAFNELVTVSKMYIRFRNTSGWGAWESVTTNKTVGELSQLQTSQKGNLVSAINEAFQFANDGKTRIAQVIGSPVVTGDTFTQMQTKIQTIKNNLGRILRLKGQTASDTDSLSSMVAKVENITTGIKTLSGEVNSLPGDYGFQHADGTQALSPLLQVTGLPFRPKKITVRAVQGSLLLETYYDDSRTLFANTATKAQYSNEPSFNFTGRPISMNAQNGYITDSGFSIPVGLPAHPYTWYIEG